jgi:hypothetical protein
MPQEKPEPHRIRELEDALKEAERRVAEMRAERDQAFELVEQMKEHVGDVDALIDSWIEAFEMPAQRGWQANARCAAGEYQENSR